MDREKQKIIEMGNFTINPIHLNILLTPAENIIFNIIMHFEDVNQIYISLSVLELYSSFAKSSVIRMKNNLIKLNFIEILKETNKGSVIIIKWKEIYNILKKIDDEKNIVNKLKICDEYRFKHNLNVTNKGNINKYTNSAFDISLNNQKPEIERIEQKKGLIKESKDVIVIQLNDIQKQLEVTEDLTEKNELNNEINRLKRLAKSKNKNITFNTNKKLWIITKY